MRIASPVIVVVAAGLLALPASAQAQNPPAQNPSPDTAQSGAVSGQVDVGLRGSFYTNNSDEARAQRYRDLRSGAVADYLRMSKDAGKWSFSVHGDHIGYRDQRYRGDYIRPGKLKIQFEFNQIPLFFSEDTATPYTSTAPGTFSLPDTQQLAVQSGQAKLADYIPLSPQFDLRLKRSITDVRLVYNATKNVDVSVTFRDTLKKGQQQWSGTFGFGDAVEFPVPVDTNTADLGAAAEWMNDRADLRVGYDGSFFRNNNQVLVWDNPLRLTDNGTGSGPGQGRESLWPDTTLNSGSISGLVKLPMTSQATAYVSLGDWSQNQALIPFTINSALAAPPLDRPTADAKARVTATALSFNTRAFEHLALNARFRSYNFDNRTPLFHVTQTVAYDTNLAAFAEGGNTLYSFDRKTFDADALWTPMTHAALRAAYTRDNLSQTFRTFDTQHEDTVRLSADATGMSWVTLRGVYEYARRTGTGLDEQSLDDIGEQTSLRQFDIANRTTNRFSGIAILQPKGSVSFNATAFVGRIHLPDSAFGLQQNDGDGVGFGADYVPNDRVSAGGSYLFERYHSLQRSRQANPGVQFDDPTRDWTTDAKDHAHTIQASVDLLKLWSKTDVRLGYDFSYAASNYVYGLTPNTTLPPVSQLPQVLNRRHRLTGDARRAFNRHLGLDVMLWYETYHVDDFAFSPVTLTSVAQPSFLTLAYLYRPYTVTTAQARLTYFW